MTLTAWCLESFLELDRNKTEIFVVFPKSQRQKMLSYLSTLSLSVSKSGVFQSFWVSVLIIASISSQTDSEKLVHAFISSRIDYCNALFARLSKSSVGWLQLIHNAAARILTGTRKCHHITPGLKALCLAPSTI